MGFRHALAPWKASILIGAVVAALLVSCESRSSTPGIVPRTVASQMGPRTPAEVRWASAINALCVRRNERLRHATAALDIWDDYAREARALQPPGTYRRRAQMLARVERAMRDSLVRVRNQARAGHDVAAAEEIRAFKELMAASAAGFAYIGVPDCAEFRPYGAS